MSPVEEDIVRSGLTEETGTSATTGEPEEAPEGGDEGRGRRTGVALILVGCILMALAAAEASAATGPAGACLLVWGVKGG